MNIAFNPKDSNTFASACLDRTVKVWSLGSPTANFTLDAHDKGVNYVEYYHGGDKPYLVTTGDDRSVSLPLVTPRRSLTVPSIRAGSSRFGTTSRNLASKLSRVTPQTCPSPSSTHLSQSSSRAPKMELSRSGIPLPTDLRTPSTMASNVPGVSRTQRKETTSLSDSTRARLLSSLVVRNPVSAWTLRAKSSTLVTQKF